MRRVGAAGRALLRAPLSSGLLRNAATPAARLHRIPYDFDKKASDDYSGWAEQFAAEARPAPAAEFVEGTVAAFMAFSEVVSHLFDGGAKSFDFKKAVTEMGNARYVGSSMVPEESAIITSHFSSVLHQGWTAPGVNPNNVACARDFILSAKLVSFKPPKQPSEPARAVVSIDLIAPCERMAPTFAYYFSRIRAVDDFDEAAAGKPFGVNERRQIAVMLSRGGHAVLRIVQVLDFFSRKLFNRDFVIQIHEPFWERLPAPWNTIGEGGVSLEKLVEMEYDTEKARWRINGCANQDINYANPAAKIAE